jgi:hypothetical protein
VRLGEVATGRGGWGEARQGRWWRGRSVRRLSGGGVCLGGTDRDMEGREGS